MLAFHAHLRRGERPAPALAFAQQAASRRRYTKVAAAAGFACFGAG